MKKTLVVLLSACMMVSLFAGCGKTSKVVDESKKSDVKLTASIEEVAQKKDSNKSPSDLVENKASNEIKVEDMDKSLRSEVNSLSAGSCIYVPVYLYNYSDFDIYNAYLSPVNSPYWSVDLLGTSVLYTNQQIYLDEIYLDSDTLQYDVRLVDEDGYDITTSVDFSNLNEYDPYYHIEIVGDLYSGYIVRAK